MTTASPPVRTPSQSGPPRPPVAHAAPGGGSTIDPVKLLKQHYPMLVLAFLIGTGLGVAAHLTLQRVYPVWSSKVIFEVRPPQGDVVAPTRAEVGRDAEERYLGTQIQLMTSNLILTQAVKDKELIRTDWAKDFVDSRGVIEVERAVRQLQKDASSRTIPQTSLLQLTVSTHRDVDAAIIANAVADSYVQDHRNRGLTASQNQRTALTTQISALKTTISELKTARENVLKDNSIDQLELSVSSPSIELTNVMANLVKVRGDLSSVTSQMEDYEARLKDNRTEQIPERLREEIQRDPVFQQYEQKIASLNDSLSALLKQGYGANHPDVVAVRANIDASGRQRDEFRDKRLLEMRSADIDSNRTAMLALKSQREQLESESAKLDARRQAIQQAKIRFEQIVSDLTAAELSLSEYQRAFDNIQIISSRANEKSEAVGDRVRIVEAAETPKTMAFPQQRMLAPVRAFRVTALVRGRMVRGERRAQPVRGPNDAAMVPRVKVLGIVPQASDDPARPAAVETVFRDAPAGVLTESFRQIRAPMIQKMEQSGLRSVMVIGGMPGSGATTVISNLALACAGAGERVLIIDANFRRPAMQRVFKIPDGPGLADVLAGSGSLAETVHTTDTDCLSVLCAGSAAARAVPERLASEAMTRLMLEAVSSYDRVFVDVPPAIVAGDGMAVANRCDAAIIVVRAYSEKRGLLARIRNQLSDTRAEFLGVVVNAVRASAGGYFKRNIKATHQYQNGKK